MVRRVFYSFHYERDNWRAAQVRNIRTMEGNQPARDNDWETVTRGGTAAIKRWIARQMKGRSCTVVLVGTDTAERPWIEHEIIKSWNDRMGVVGIHIHGLLNRHGQFPYKGRNPFNSLKLGESRLSSIVKCYDPAGANSREKYAWIARHLANAVEEAIQIRQRYY